MLMTRSAMTSVVFVALFALSLVSVAAAKAGGTLEVGEETLAIIYRTIGENQSVRQAIEAALGQATPETSRLLALSSEQLVGP
jgi:HEAT repeat protein